jgi:4-hydroxyphenylpyruvate dioxygenase-like putative hemolysin
MVSAVVIVRAVTHLTSPDRREWMQHWVLFFAKLVRARLRNNQCALP